MGRGLSDLQQRIVVEVKKRGGLTYKEAYELFCVKIPAVKYSKENSKEWRRYQRKVETERERIRHVMGRFVKRGLVKRWYRPLEIINIRYEDFRDQLVPSGVQWVNVPVLSTRTHKRKTVCC